MKMGKIHKCCVCDKGYKSISGLNYHSYIHNPSPVSCSYCPKIYNSPFYKRQHEYRCHKNELLPKTKSSFEVNGVNDNKIEPNTSQHTGRNQQCKSVTLTEHQRSMEDITKVRIFRCGYCPHAYFVVSELKYHMLSVHENMALGDVGNSSTGFNTFKYDSTLFQRSPLPSTSSSLNNTKCNVTSQEKRQQATFSSSTEVSGSAKLSVSKNYRMERSCETVISKRTQRSREEIRIVKPIGNLLYCPYCGDEFYDKKYIHWHLKISHRNRKQIRF